MIPAVHLFTAIKNQQFLHILKLTKAMELTWLLRNIRLYLNVIYVIPTINLPPQFPDDGVYLSHSFLVEVKHGPLCGLIIAIQVTYSCFFYLLKLKSLVWYLYHTFCKYFGHQLRWFNQSPTAWQVAMDTASAGYVAVNFQLFHSNSTLQYHVYTDFFTNSIHYRILTTSDWVSQWFQLFNILVD